MAAGLDKFQFVQSGAFFPPAIAAGNQFDSIDQLALYPVGLALPLNVGGPVLEMNRTRLAVESHASPVPHFKRENVGRGADFQYQRVRSGTMHGSGRNEKMIVLSSRPLVHVIL